MPTRPPLSLKGRALALLARREYSRTELAGRLAAHAESPEQLAAVLDDLAQRQWQSDTRFAEQFVHHRVARYGSRKLAFELASRGVDKDTISETLAEHTTTDLHRAHALWLRRFNEIPTTPEARLKQMRFLASRGFSNHVIQKVLQLGYDDLPDG